MDIRHEHDSVGNLDVPSDAYYGVHSQRAVVNFPMTGEKLHIEQINGGIGIGGAFVRRLLLCRFAFRRLGLIRPFIGLSALPFYALALDKTDYLNNLYGLLTNYPYIVSEFHLIPHLYGF